MSQQDLSHYVPRRLDSPAKFLFWDLDIAAIGVVGMMLGVGSGFPILGMLVGAAAAFGYSRLKSGKHPGMAAHLLYWWTGAPAPKEMPASHLRELNG